MHAPVAILIVNFKAYGELGGALRSLASARGEADEVVVLDQASDPAQLSTVVAAHPGVRVIASDQNVGFARGVNRAAAAVSPDARYLLLLNPDARVDAGVIRALATFLDAHPTVGLVGPRVLNSDGTVQASARRFPTASTALAGRSTWLTRRFPHNWLTRHNLIGREAREPVTVDWLAGSCVMVRRDLFERLGGFDEAFFMYWEDADLARRAKTLGLASVYVPTVSVQHAGGKSAAWNPAPSIRAFHRSAYRYYWKHGRLARIAAPVVWAALWLRGEIHARRHASRAAD